MTAVACRSWFCGRVGYPDVIELADDSDYLVLDGVTSEQPYKMVYRLPGSKVRPIIPGYKPESFLESGDYPGLEVARYDKIEG